MIFYRISETLEESTPEKCLNSKSKYAAVLTPQEWIENSERFDMVIDLDLEYQHPHFTKAEVNYDSLTGTFSIPSKEDITGERDEFAFALDEKGIVFIDRDGSATRLIKDFAATRKCRMPGLERFLYDFLEMIISGDLAMLEHYEHEMNRIEADILSGKADGADVISRVNEIRGELLDLRTYYEQMIDLGQELEENENGFFYAKNLRYFRMFTDRVERLQDIVTSLRDYTVQLRDLYHSQLDMKQNRIMTVLTVVTTIFVPLAFLTGWYGMNFENMPELSSPMGYPIVIAVSAAIVIGCLIFFKLKKWL